MDSYKQTGVYVYAFRRLGSIQNEWFDPYLKTMEDILFHSGQRYRPLVVLESGSRELYTRRVDHEGTELQIDIEGLIQDGFAHVNFYMTMSDVIDLDVNGWAKAEGKQESAEWTEIDTPMPLTGIEFHRATGSFYSIYRQAFEDMKILAGQYQARTVKHIGNNFSEHTSSVRPDINVHIRI